MDWTSERDNKARHGTDTQEKRNSHNFPLLPPFIAFFRWRWSNAESSRESSFRREVAILGPPLRIGGEGGVSQVRKGVGGEGKGREGKGTAPPRP